MATKNKPAAPVAPAKPAAAEPKPSKFDLGGCLLVGLGLVTILVISSVLCGGLYLLASNVSSTTRGYQYPSGSTEPAEPVQKFGGIVQGEAGGTQAPEASAEGSGPGPEVEFECKLGDAGKYFCEPGVLLDETAAYDHFSAETTPVLVPEGGYTYVAVGSLTVGNAVKLPWVDRNIYLVVLKGVLSDGNPKTDLNLTVNLSGYKRGTGIYSPLPAGSFVSAGWFYQQITNAFASSPNCGVDGCKTVTVVVVDYSEGGDSPVIYKWILENSETWGEVEE